MPSILLLLLAGFAVGPVTGVLDPDALLGDLLVPVVSLSVGIILFEGGLSLRAVELRQVGGVVRNLITVGLVVTWAITALAARVLLDLGWDIALLLGAILVVSGPTVIVPLLRHLKPSGSVGHALKWEGILIDPIGVLLAVVVFEAVLVGGAEPPAAVVVGTILRALVVGGIMGIAGAGVVYVVLRRHWAPDALQNPMTLLVVVAAFTVADLVQTESGLVAATVMGVVLANQRRVSLRHIIEFKENLRVLFVSFLFIVLAARLEPASLSLLTAESVLFVLMLVLVARPAAAFLSTWGSSMPWRERLFLAAIAPRGIVAALMASVFALRLEEVGDPSGALLAPYTLLAIVGTVAISGLAAAPVARALKVAEPDPQGVVLVGAHAWGRSLGHALSEEGIEVLLVDTNQRNLQAAWDLGLRTYHGSTLTETVLEEIDLGGMGHLLGITSNDEVNALTVLHFGEAFERSRVYQLTPAVAKDAEGTSVPAHLRGRLLFGEDVTFARLTELTWRGWQIERIPLEGRIDETGVLEVEEAPLPLCLVRAAGGAAFFTADARPNGSAGDVLVALVPP